MTSRDHSKTVDYKSITKHALSGSFAGVVGTVFGHPLDVVKVNSTQSDRNKFNISFEIKFTAMWQNRSNSMNFRVFSNVI